MAVDVRNRFDAGLASGPGVAAPIEPGARAAEVADLDRLSGRPLFEAIEGMAERAAQGRPATTGAATWYLPHADLAQRTVRIDEVAASAVGLAREIETRLPHARIAVVGGDRLAESLLTANRDGTVDAIAERVAGWFGAAAGQAGRSDAANAIPRRLDDVGVGQLFSFDAKDDAGHRLGGWYLAAGAAAWQLPRARAEGRVARLLEDHGVEMRGGYAPPAQPADLARGTNDHELGHVVSYAIGLRGGRDSAHADYLEECRADCFEVAMAAARGRPAGGVAENLAQMRDLGAALNFDTAHWTSPVVRAMAARCDGLMASGTLHFMPPDAVMRECAAVTHAHALDEADYSGFRAALHARVEEFDLPTGEQPTPAGRDAAAAALAGYARARTAGAVAERVSTDTVDRWTDDMIEANPQHRRLLALTPRQIQLDDALDRVAMLAYHGSGTPADTKAIAGALSTALKAGEKTLGVEASIRRGEGGEGDVRQGMQEVAALSKVARDIQRRPAPSEGDLKALASVPERAATAMARGGAWFAAASKSFQQVEMSVGCAMQDARPAPRARDRAPERD